MQCPLRWLWPLLGVSFFGQSPPTSWSVVVLVVVLDGWLEYGMRGSKVGAEEREMFAKIHFCYAKLTVEQKNWTVMLVPVSTAMYDDEGRGPEHVG